MTRDSRRRLCGALPEYRSPTSSCTRRYQRTRASGSTSGPGELPELSWRESTRARRRSIRLAYGDSGASAGPRRATSSAVASGPDQLRPPRTRPPLRSLRAHGDHVGAVDPHLGRVCEHLVEHRRLGGHADDRRARVEQGDRPVLHLARRCCACRGCKQPQRCQRVLKEVTEMRYLLTILAAAVALATLAYLLGQ